MPGHFAVRRQTAPAAAHRCHPVHMLQAQQTIKMGCLCRSSTDHLHCDSATSSLIHPGPGNKWGQQKTIRRTTRSDAIRFCRFFTELRVWCLILAAQHCSWTSRSGQPVIQERRKQPSPILAEPRPAAGALQSFWCFVVAGKGLKAQVIFRRG